MPEGVSWVLFLSGPVVAAAYLLSSLTRSWVVERGDRPSPAVVTEALTILAVAAGAWLVIRSQAPGRTVFANASAVGFLSSQVLTFWSSMALWSGLAAVIGQVAPLPRRFAHGSSGITGAVLLLVAFLPVTALASFGAWISARLVTGEVRNALVLTFGSAVAAEWLFAVLNPPGPWGVIHGPESTLFVAALAGVLLFRWSRGDVGADSRILPDGEWDGTG